MRTLTWHFSKCKKNAQKRHALPSHSPFKKRKKEFPSAPLDFSFNTIIPAMTLREPAQWQNTTLNIPLMRRLGHCTDEVVHGFTALNCTHASQLACVSSCNRKTLSFAKTLLTLKKVTHAPGSNCFCLGENSAKGKSYTQGEGRFNLLHMRNRAATNHYLCCHLV